MRNNNEQGIVIVLVAVVMLFVVGAMAALSIDVVTLYTARSEAQLAADAAALAGARVLANSGLTSTAAGPAGAKALATMVATQVATYNDVGGRKLNSSEVVVAFNDAATTFATDPHVTVTVTRTDLPTFFARIWGSKQITVAARATAEAYNPSGANALGGPTTPVAPICVKPWLVPNISPNPTPANPQIFDPGTGAILDTNLLNYETAGPPNRLQPACAPDCSGGTLPAALAYYYYPGDPTTTLFQPPTQALPSCTPALTSPYQNSVAGCVQTPVSCHTLASIDLSSNPTRNAETADAVNCLTHAQNNNGDQYDSAAGAGPPFQFVAGSDNPVPGLAGNVVMVSDSLVTVPVFDSSSGVAPTVQIIGFLQLFLNPAGTASPTPPPGALGSMRTKVINMVGCGTGATGTPILGNGASPVAVRLISP